MNGLLDDDSEEHFEVIEKKWLIPLVICFLTFAYLNNAVYFIVPGGLEHAFSPMLIINAGYLAGGIIYILTGKKQWAIYTGFILLTGFCIITTLLLVSGFNLAWSDLFLYALGCGLVFYAVLTRFLQGSYPQGKKQTLFLLLIFLQIIAYFVMRIADGKYINPETTGVFPFIICAVLYLVAVRTIPRKNKNEQHPVTENQSALHPPSGFLLTAFSLFMLLKACMDISTMIVSNIESDFQSETMFIRAGTLILSCFIAVWFLAHRKRPSYKQLLRIGLSVILISCSMNMVIGDNEGDFYHTYLIITVHQLVNMGENILLVGVLAYLIQFYRHRNFTFFVVIPNTAANIPFLLFLIVDSRLTASLYKNGFYLINICILALTTYLLFTLNQKPKPNGTTA